MAAERSIAESRLFSTENAAPEEGNWQPIGELAARLKAEIDQAIAARDEVAASEAHTALVDLEHCERIAATVRRYTR
jgi:hypothetical protein